MISDSADKLARTGLQLLKEFPRVGTAAEVFKVFIPDNTEAVREALLDEMHADVNRLKEKV